MVPMKDQMEKNGLLFQKTAFSRSNVFQLGNSSTIRGISLLIYLCSSKSQDWGFLKEKEFSLRLQCKNPA